MSNFAVYGSGNRNPRNVILESELLDRIGPILRIDQFLEKKPVPAKEGETIMWQRAVVPSTVIAQVTEGVNPAGRQLQYETVSKTLEEYAESYACSSRADELGQTDIVKDMADVLSDLVALTRETIGWNGVKACSNIIYNASTITTLNTVNGAISGSRLDVALRFLDGNKAKYFREATKGALEENTSPVEAAYVCLCHTDCEADIRLLPGFRPAPEVGGGGKGPDGWFGNWRKVAFVTSPEFKPDLAAGAAIGSTGMKSVAGVNIDVYSYVLFGKKAFGRVGLKGMGKAGFGGVKAYTIKGADHADLTGQRVASSVRWYDGLVELQSAHAINIKCGVTANP